MKIDNYYLDLEKVNSISSPKEREQIHRYYMDFLHFSQEGRDSMAKSIMVTLIKGEYLVDIRDEKIKKLLDE